MSQGNSPEQLEQQVSADLVERIAQGERSAEAQMVVRYGRGLLCLLRRKTHDPALAEDLYQETFRVAIERLRSRGIDQPQQLASFLHGVAGNLVISHFRKERRRGTTADEAKLAALPDPSDQAVALLAREQLRGLVRRLLDELSVARDRELLIRYFVEDEDKERICAALGLDSLHFNRVLFRAKQRFRTLVLENERRDAQPQALPQPRAGLRHLTGSRQHGP